MRGSLRSKADRQPVWSLRAGRAAIARASGRAAWCARPRSPRTTSSGRCFLWTAPIFVSPYLRCPGWSGFPSIKPCATRSEGRSLPFPALRYFRTRIPACATKLAARRSTPTISFAARSARSRKRCRKSASCATLPSIPTPATGMTGCCETAASATTKQSRSWSGRRAWKQRRAATSSPLRT